jgi:hypothetical protein
VLAEASKQFAVRGEALQALGLRAEAKEILAAAKTLSSQADAVKAGENLKTSLEAAQSLAGKMELLSRPDLAREKSAE